MGETSTCSVLVLLSDTWRCGNMLLWAIIRCPLGIFLFGQKHGISWKYISKEQLEIDSRYACINYLSG